MAYRVPFVDYPAHFQSLEKELTPILKDVLFKRADLILRSDVVEFEKNLAAYLGVKYAVGVNSCTDALFLTLRAAGVNKGDEVITVAQTFVATLEPVVHCGANPVLVDIGEDFNMNADLLERRVTKKTKVILPVHLNGRLCDMDKIFSVARKHHLIVIEDAAQALGATFKGKKAGSFGLAGCFSFYPAKILGAAGDAGIVCTNSKRLAGEVRLLRDHGRKTKNHLAFYGFNSRLDNLQAAILNFKLTKYLPRWIERRRRIARKYYEGLYDVPAVRLPHFEGREYFDVYQNYVIRAKKRNALVKHLKKCGIEVLISWPVPLNKQKTLGLAQYALPETEKASRDVVSLPMNTEISDAQIQYVIRCVKGFYSA